MSSRQIDHPNVALLRRVAERLGALREEVVFLGGASAQLLITDPAAGPVRGTVDVDVVIEVASRSAYRHIQRRLRQAGFKQDQRPDAPLCRWLVDRIAVDVMPTDGSILGFSNRWYTQQSLPPRLVTSYQAGWRFAWLEHRSSWPQSSKHFDNGATVISTAVETSRTSSLSLTVGSSW